MTVVRSVARAVASPVARSVAGGIGGSPWQLLLSDPNLVVRLNGDANADGTGDPNDYTGSYNATWTGTPAYLDPAPLSDGKAFSLDGSTQHLTIPSDAGNFTDNFSFCCWVYLNTLVSSPRIISKRGSPTGWEFFAQSTGARLGIFCNSGTINSAASSLTTASWIHVGFVINGAASKFFVGGVQSDSDFNPTITANAVNPTVGRYAPSAAEWLDGRISDLRIYNRALSASEFSTIAEGP